MDKNTSYHFRQMAPGCGLTTADIAFAFPDDPDRIMPITWQTFDTYPDFPVLNRFLGLWQRMLEGRVLSVVVAHHKLLKPTELRVTNGEFRLH